MIKLVGIGHGDIHLGNFVPDSIELLYVRLQELRFFIVMQHTSLGFPALLPASRSAMRGCRVANARRSGHPGDDSGYRLLGTDVQGAFASGTERFERRHPVKELIRKEHGMGAKMLPMTIVLGIGTAIASLAYAESGEEEFIGLMESYIEVAHRWIQMAETREAAVFFAIEGITESMRNVASSA